MIASYCGFSTSEQELSRQVDATREYAMDTLNADPGDLELSKRQAAREIDTSRAAIDRALDRGNLWFLIELVRGHSCGSVEEDHRHRSSDISVFLQVFFDGRADDL